MCMIFPQSRSMNYVCVNSKKNVKSRVETHVSIRAEKSQINRGSLILGEKKIFDMLTVRHLNTGIFKVFFMLYVHMRKYVHEFSQVTPRKVIYRVCVNCLIGVQHQTLPTFKIILQLFWLLI